MRFENVPVAVIRLPSPATLRNPDEKIRNEAAVMHYVREHTSIPIPWVIHQGRADQANWPLGHLSSWSIWDMAPRCMPARAPGESMWNT
jgi:hypothetical protein